MVLYIMFHALAGCTRLSQPVKGEARINKGKNTRKQKNTSRPSKAMPSFLIRKNIEKEEEEKTREERGKKSRLETETNAQPGHLYLLELSASSPSSQGLRGSTKVEMRWSPHRAPTVTQTCF